MASAENAQSTQQHTVYPQGVHGLGVLALLFCAFTLRLNRLGQESLWYDELVSVDLAASTIRDLIAQTARDIHPPGYYLLLHGWQRISSPTVELGHSFEFLYAFPSAFFGLIVCALVYSVARLFFSPSVALLSLAFAALHPFQIDYSQEVRMYTLGAGLCLLYLRQSHKLLHALKVHGTPQPLLKRRTQWKTVLLLGTITAAGLYTFYYFGFLMAAAGIAVVVWGIVQARSISREQLRVLRMWLGAHVLGLLLWLPWMPIFVRQALEPPVPPWREPWQGIAETFSALLETATVYLVGHAYHAPIWIGLAGLCVVAIGLVLAYAQKWRLTPSRGEEIVYLGVFAFGPPLLIILISSLLTPLFHPRYLYVYHAPFLILLAAVLVALTARTASPSRQTATRLLPIIFLLTFAGGTIHLWTDPVYRADDHRGAVARIAQEWRPGQVILVNAGWVYRAFQVYWPTETVNVDDALPPRLAPRLRLAPHPEPRHARQYSPESEGVPLFYSGSIDGAESLGWHNPQADFFAVSAQDTIDALDQLSTQATALWHYRIYDTVSDPNATIRTWLADHANLLTSEPLPGRDFLRLEQYALPGDPPQEQDITPTSIAFHWPNAPAEEARSENGSQSLLLTAFDLPHAATGGQKLYVPLHFAFPPTFAEANALHRLGISMRLVDSEGVVYAQDDFSISLSPAAHASTAHTEAVQHRDALVAALPVSVATPPGDYRLVLLVYDPETLIPLIPRLARAQTAGVDAAEQAAISITPENGVNLGRITVQLPPEPPSISDSPNAPHAQFDYIRLLTADWGQSLDINAPNWEIVLVWEPQPSPYRDNYDVILEWKPVDTQGTSTNPTSVWRAPLGPASYPSANWQTGYPVQQIYRLDLPARLAPGTYTIRLGMRRTADGAPIPTRRWWGLAQAEWKKLGTITLVE